MKKSKKEDASVNALGAIPSGRLMRRYKTRINRPTVDRVVNIKGESMSLAKKYMKILFEEEMPMEAPEAPMAEPEMEAPAAEAPQADAEMLACCDELDKLVAEMEDGEQKEKLMACAAKMRACCQPAEEEEMEEPESEEEESEESEMED